MGAPTTLTSSPNPLAVPTTLTSSATLTNAAGLPIVTHPAPPNLARLAHMPQNIPPNTAPLSMPPTTTITPTPTINTVSTPAPTPAPAPAITGGAAGKPTLTSQQLQQFQSMQHALPPHSLGISPDDNEIISRRKLHELVAQLSAHEKLDTEVEEVLIEFIEDFIEQVTSSACGLAKHRGSNVLEVKDLVCHLEKTWNIRIPGFGSTAAEGAPTKPFKRTLPSQAHQTRLALVKRSLLQAQAQAHQPPAKHARTSSGGGGSSSAGGGSSANAGANANSETS